MRRSSQLGIALLLAAGVLATPLVAASPPPVTRPGTIGDQVVFYYDARDGFTTFVSLRNGGASALAVEVLLYGPSLDAPFRHVVTLPVGPGEAGEPGVGGLVTLDVGGLRGLGLAAQPGVGFATAIDTSGRPIATRFLSGNFTVANLRTGSAWGAPGLARSAVLVQDPDPDPVCPSGPPRPARGALIDGVAVAFPAIQPGRAELAAFPDPATLAPATDGGNQLIFVSFEDVPGSVFDARAGSVTWAVDAVRTTGERLEPTEVASSGVEVSDLVAVAGPGVVGASGSLSFRAEETEAPVTQLVFFTQALGTFGAGYLLPR